MKNKIFIIILLVVAIIGITTTLALTIYTVNEMNNSSITSVISNEA